MQWFLSYNSRDFQLAESVLISLKHKEADAIVFFAPKSLLPGTYWAPELAKGVAESKAFILLVGENGLGPWQVIEYYEALDKRVKEPDYPLILVLLQGCPAPGLSFLRHLHWIVTPDPASEQSISQLTRAAQQKAEQPSDLWRYTAPYRGLAAMTEADSDFFFGRARETSEVLEALARVKDRIPILLGNSGVGKSSLAQAGVLASLKRQAPPPNALELSSWPIAFRNSRSWCFLKLRPGQQPLRSLIQPFLATWQMDTTDPKWEVRESEWVSSLLSGQGSLRGLLDATERRYEELGGAKPPSFLLYIDQGEELYVRADESQRRRFSEVLASGMDDPRLYAFMSMRSDFLGALQNDGALFAVHRQINVPPLREEALMQIVSNPADMLSARFETDQLASDIARRAADESAKEVGALPLLSYLLDDMWTQMVQRQDGVLRLPPHAVEIGGVLAERANAFLVSHPISERLLRRILTLKLANVREDGEPTRRRALRSEFSDEEWRLVSELADHPNRLVATATPDGGETYAEVAHEAIFRRWNKLREWITAEREFLIWKSALEVDRKRRQLAPPESRDDALLMGLALAQAKTWLDKRGDDLSQTDKDFINLSLERGVRERQLQTKLRRRVTAISTAALLLILIASSIGYLWFKERGKRLDAALAGSVGTEVRNTLVRAAYLVYLRSSDGRTQAIGTAVPIRGDLLATTASVASLDISYSGGRLLVRSPGIDGREYEVIERRAHPFYEPLNRFVDQDPILVTPKPVGDVRSQQLRGFGYDVGVLRVAPNSALQPVLEIADPLELQALKPGLPIALAGYMLENIAGSEAQIYGSTPTLGLGVVTAITDMFGLPAEPAQRRLIEHNIPVRGGSAGSPIVSATGRLIAVENAFKNPDARKSANAAVDSFGQRADYLRDMLTDGALGTLDDERRYWVRQTDKFKRAFDVVVANILDKNKPNAFAAPVLISQEKLVLIPDDRVRRRDAESGREVYYRQQRRNVTLQAGEPRMFIAYGEHTAPLKLYLAVNNKIVAQDESGGWYPHIAYTPSAGGNADIYILGNDTDVTLTFMNYGWQMRSK